MKDKIRFEVIGTNFISDRVIAGARVDSRPATFVNCWE